MSIIGWTVKGTVGLVANGLDYIIKRGARSVGKRYGENQIVKTASEIGMSTVRVTESTVKTLTDVVDGGIEAGSGYLAKDETKIAQGWQKSKSAGKELVSGVKQGLLDTYGAGYTTTGSAVQAGKHYITGDKRAAAQELANTKAHAMELGKLVVIGLLAVGTPTKNGETPKRE
jgi:hypothetical protein